MTEEPMAEEPAAEPKVEPMAEEPMAEEPAAEPKVENTNNNDPVDRTIKGAIIRAIDRTDVNRLVGQPGNMRISTGQPSQAQPNPGQPNKGQSKECNFEKIVCDIVTELLKTIPTHAEFKKMVSESKLIPKIKEAIIKINEKYPKENNYPQNMIAITKISMIAESRLKSKGGSKKRKQKSKHNKTKKNKSKK